MVTVSSSGQIGPATIATSPISPNFNHFTMDTYPRSPTRTVSPISPGSRSRHWGSRGISRSSTISHPLSPRKVVQEVELGFPNPSSNPYRSRAPMQFTSPQVEHSTHSSTSTALATSTNVKHSRQNTSSSHSTKESAVASSITMTASDNSDESTPINTTITKPWVSDEPGQKHGSPITPPRSTTASPSFSLFPRLDTPGSTRRLPPSPPRTALTPPPASLHSTSARPKTPSPIEKVKELSKEIGKEIGKELGRDKFPSLCPRVKSHTPIPEESSKSQSPLPSPPLPPKSQSLTIAPRSKYSTHSPNSNPRSPFSTAFAAAMTENDQAALQNRQQHVQRSSGQHLHQPNNDFAQQYDAIRERRSRNEPFARALNSAPSWAPRSSSLVRSHTAPYEEASFTSPMASIGAAIGSPTHRPSNSLPPTLRRSVTSSTDAEIAGTPTPTSARRPSAAERISSRYLKDGPRRHNTQLAMSNGPEVEAQWVRRSDHQLPRKPVGAAHSQEYRHRAASAPGIDQERFIFVPTSIFASTLARSGQPQLRIDTDLNGYHPEPAGHSRNTSQGSNVLPPSVQDEDEEDPEDGRSSRGRSLHRLRVPSPTVPADPMSAMSDASVHIAREVSIMGHRQQASGFAASTVRMRKQQTKFDPLQIRASVFKPFMAGEVDPEAQDAFVALKAGITARTVDEAEKAKHSEGSAPSIETTVEISNEADKAVDQRNLQESMPVEFTIDAGVVGYDFDLKRPTTAPTGASRRNKRHQSHHERKTSWNSPQNSEKRHSHRRQHFGDVQVPPLVRDCSWQQQQQQQQRPSHASTLPQNQHRYHHSDDQQRARQPSDYENYRRQTQQPQQQLPRRKKSVSLPPSTTFSSSKQTKNDIQVRLQQSTSKPLPPTPPSLAFISTAALEEMDHGPAQHHQSQQLGNQQLTYKQHEERQRRQQRQHSQHSHQSQASTSRYMQPYNVTARGGTMHRAASPLAALAMQVK